MKHEILECSSENTCDVIQGAFTENDYAPTVIDIYDPNREGFEAFRLQTQQGYSELRGWATIGSTQQSFHTHNEPTVLALPSGKIRTKPTLVRRADKVAKSMHKLGSAPADTDAFSVDQHLETLMRDMKRGELLSFLDALQEEELDPDEEICWKSHGSNCSRFAIVPHIGYVHAQKMGVEEETTTQLRWAFLSTLKP